MSGPLCTVEELIRGLYTNSLTCPLANSYIIDVYQFEDICKLEICT